MSVVGKYASTEKVPICNVVEVCETVDVVCVVDCVRTEVTRMWPSLWYDTACYSSVDGVSGETELAAVDYG